MNAVLDADTNSLNRQPALYQVKQHVALWRGTFSLSNKFLASLATLSLTYVKLVWILGDYPRTSCCYLGFKQFYLNQVNPVVALEAGTHSLNRQLDFNHVEQYDWRSTFRCTFTKSSTFVLSLGTVSSLT